MKIQHIIFLSLTALLLGGCGPSLNIKNLDDLTPEQLEKADPAPTPSEISDSSNKPKIVIADFLEPADVHIKKLSLLSGLAREMTGNTEKYLSDAGVTLIAREEAASLLNEVQLSEMQGKVGQYNGPSVAQYVIIGRINSITTSSDFTEGSTYKNKKGEIIRISPECNYKANVTGRLRIYLVPELRMVKTIPLEQDSSSREDSRGSCNKHPASFTNLIREAGDQAVKSSRILFQNFFTPKGYILEKRLDQKKALSFFKINLGSNRDLKQGAQVEVYNKTSETNPLTGKVSLEERKIATGYVTNQMGEKYAWILIEDLEKANRVKLGNYVTMKFKKGWGENVGEFFDGL